MGWTLLNKPKDQTVEDFFRQEFGPKVVDFAMDYRDDEWTAYMAYKTELGNVALVVMLDLTHQLGYNFGYKDMDETMGPRQQHCPQRILEQLSAPPANEYAREWRKLCWINADITRWAKEAKEKAND